MAAIDFPNSPVVNDLFTSGTQTWKWDGISWNLVTTSNPTFSTITLPSGTVPQLTIGTVAGAENYILMPNTSGVAAPTITTARSIGSKIILYPSFSNGVSADYAIGIAGNTQWYSVPQATAGFSFKWYGGATVAATLTGLGALTTAGSITVGAEGSSALSVATLSRFGAASTAGTLDWNHSSNLRAGVGPTLLLGNATNGPGPAIYFHPMNFEYGGTYDGTGQLTQLAIPYANIADSSGIYMRGRYLGVWTGWQRIQTTGVGKLLNATYEASGALNPVTATATVFATVNVSVETGDTVLISGTFDVSSSNASSPFVGTCNIAGTEQTKQAVYQVASRVMLHQRWKYTATSTGTIAIALAGRYAGAASTYVVNSTHSALVIEVYR